MIHALKHAAKERKKKDACQPTSKHWSLFLGYSGFLSPQFIELLEFHIQ
jgi:hypothetical protein